MLSWGCPSKSSGTSTCAQRPRTAQPQTATVSCQVSSLARKSQTWITSEVLFGFLLLMPNASSNPKSSRERRVESQREHCFPICLPWTHLTGSSVFLSWCRRARLSQPGLEKHENGVSSSAKRRHESQRSSSPGAQLLPQLTLQQAWNKIWSCPPGGFPSLWSQGTLTCCKSMQKVHPCQLWCFDCNSYYSWGFPWSLSCYNQES